MTMGRVRWSPRVYASRASLLEAAVFGRARAVVAAMARADEHSAERLLRAIDPVAPRPLMLRRGAAKPTDLRELLVMPVGDHCNLACTYCYEADRRQARAGVMTVGDFERILSNVLPHVSDPFLLAFHGGEPLLAGLEFFREALEIVRALGGGRIRLAIQTNATLLDEEWAALFGAHGVSVGVSIDGSALRHDSRRRTLTGLGSHEAVLRGVSALRSCSVPFGAIAVVTEGDAQSPGGATELLRSLVGLGIDEFDVHPALTHTRGGAAETLSPAAFSSFMCELFDAWLDAGSTSLKIGFFEHFFQGMTGRSPATCYLSGSCTTVMGVGPSGRAIPCTRPFDDTFVFGDLVRESLNEVLAGSAFRRFAKGQAQGQREHSCAWASLCSGGCPHDRVRDGAQAIDGRNLYCTCDGRTGGYPAIFEALREACEEALAAALPEVHLRDDGTSASTS